MSDFEKELAKAYEEATNAELDAVIAEAKKNPPVFSDRFEKSMEEMIKTGKPDKLWSDDYSDSGAKTKKLSKRGLKVLLIAAAVLLALTAVACAVPEIRESIAGFFVRIFGDHVEYSNPDITKESIEEEYGLVPVPAGYKIIKKTTTKTDLVVIYSDPDGIVMSFVQSVNPQLSYSLDSEHGEVFEHAINGKIVRVYLSVNSVQASWVEDGYYFSLTYPSGIDLNVFEEMIRLINRQ